MLETLDGPAITRWIAAAAQLLDEHRSEIDLLNVYPVPDGDTGTNLSLTMKAASAELPDLHTAAGQPAGTVLRDAARAAIIGARGNSGVILGQYLRGLADVAGSVARWDASGLGRGLARAAALAHEAVADPVEGTMLTVAHAAARAVNGGADGPGDRAGDGPGDGSASGPALAAVTRAVVTAALSALERTPEQLPALARAGVVDAGAWGLALVLQALDIVVSGEPGAIEPVRTRPARLRVAPATPAAHPEYEVQYQLAATEQDVAVLRRELAAIGNSLVVAGTGDGYWLVHVHVDDIGAAIEVGIRAGRPQDVRVTRFADQPGHLAGASRTGTAVVVVTPVDGVSDLLRAENALVVGYEHSPGGPNSADVVAAVRNAGAAAAVLLVGPAARSAGADVSPGAAVATSAQILRADGIEVAVVPVRSPVQALAALAVHDGRRHFGDDVVAMAEAAAATRFGELTVAARDALTSAGPCRAGDVLGMIDGDVVELGTDLVDVTLRVVDRLLGVGGELVTVVLHPDTPAGLGDRVTDRVHASVLGAEVVVYAGQRSDALVLLGVE